MYVFGRGRPPEIQMLPSTPLRPRCGPIADSPSCAYCPLGGQTRLYSQQCDQPSGLHAPGRVPLIASTLTILESVSGDKQLWKSPGPPEEVRSAQNGI